MLTSEKYLDHGKKFASDKHTHPNWDLTVHIILTSGGCQNFQFLHHKSAPKQSFPVKKTFSYLSERNSQSS